MANAGIPVQRAAYLDAYIRILRNLGTPIERELARSKLPSRVEETPNALVSLAFSFDFVRRCARLEGIPDLGFLAAKEMQFLDLGPAFLLASQTALTVRELLLCLVRLASLEDNMVHAGLMQEGPDTRLFCDSDFPGIGEDIRHSEWFQLNALIAVVRRGAGPRWQPAEISFVSRAPLPASVMKEFGNTRFVLGHKHTSITVPTDLLAAPVYPPQLPVGMIVAANALFADTELDVAQALGLVGTLRKIVQTYLPDGYPHIALAAEIAGTSVRTLQRNLRVQGVSYADLVLQARLESAAHILHDPHAKVSDVAMAVGYDDPSNFTRAFRRISGSGDKYWVDPMIGVKSRLQGASPWYLTGWAMIGGFGVSADIDWDLFGGVGYEFGDRFSLVAGYRAVGVDYSDDNFRFDVIQQGPIMGGVFRF